MPRRIVRTVQQAPVQWLAQIDSGNPIARGLDVVAMPNGSRFANLIGPLAFFSSASPGVGRGTPFGLGVTITGATEYALTGVPTIPDGGAGYTVLGVVVLSSVSGTQMIAQQDNSPRCYQLRFNGGAAEFIAFNTSDGPFTASRASSGAAGALAVVVGRVAGTAVSVFANGRSGSATLTGTARGCSGGSAIGNRLNSSPLNGQCLAFIRWNRPLSDAEVASVSANPWQLFEPQTRSINLAAAVSVYRPDSDVTVNGWTSTPSGTLASCIDDPTLDRADFITSPDLSSPTTLAWDNPLPAGTWDISIDGVRVGTAGQVRVVCLDAGGTSVGNTSWQVLTGTDTTYTLPVTTTATSTQFRIEVQ